MKTQIKKSNVALEYKSTLWKTEIKGPTGDRIVRRLIIYDFILSWVYRFLWILLFGATTGFALKMGKFLTILLILF